MFSSSRCKSSSLKHNLAFGANGGLEMMELMESMELMNLYK